MKNTMSLRAGVGRLARTGSWWGLVLAGLLSGCAMPARAPSPVLYDFGVAASEPVTTAVVGTQPALAASVQAPSSLEGTAVLYRLAYADAQQLRAYALARWTMPPAELVQQRLRERLSQQQPVLKPGEGAARVLHIELEEFSQVFASPEQSMGLLRLRATVLQVTPHGDRLVAQRQVVVQRPAPSADASGGVRALTAATDVAVAELAQWLQQLR